MDENGGESEMEWLGETTMRRNLRERERERVQERDTQDEDRREIRDEA